MINIIVGKKGTGKTKKLIERANEAVSKSSGKVVVIEKGSKLTYDISHDVRLIDIDEYSICGADALGGFICGICAGDYDVTDVYVDSTFKIIGEDPAALVSFSEKMDTLSSKSEINVTVLISADESRLPEKMKEISTVV